MLSAKWQIYCPGEDELMEDRDSFTMQSAYLECWWFGDDDTSNQGISSHLIDLFIQNNTVSAPEGLSVIESSSASIIKTSPWHSLENFCSILLTLKWVSLNPHQASLILPPSTQPL